MDKRMKVFCVRIGDKYGPEYETYINAKLSDRYEINWIREETVGELQWNKMSVMSMDIDEPVVVLDIDVLLLNDYQKMFDYPVDDGWVLSIPAWWGSSLPINGGFWKYTPNQMKHVYDAYIKRPHHWQNHYIDTGATRGPVNGEQNFIFDHCKIQTVPPSWVGRWASEWYIDSFDNYDSWAKAQNVSYIRHTGNEYLYLDGEFHEDVKLVHFTTPANKPHQWSQYNVHR